MSTSRLTQLTEEQRRLLQKGLDGDISSLNSTYGTSADKIRSDYESQISDTERSYNDAFEENNVKRIVNERKIAESMANSGLSDSGLNRTQVTANQLSWANADSKLRQNRQKAVDDLARVMQSSLSSLEAERASKEQSIRSSYEQQAVSNAASIYNNEVDSAAKKYAAEMEAATAAAKAKTEASAARTKARESLINALGDTMTDDKMKQALIKNYIYTYGADGSDYGLFRTLGYSSDGRKLSDADMTASDERISDFRASIMTSSEYERRHRFKNLDYPGYIEDKIRQWYDSGKLNDAEAAELLAYYNTVSVK